MKNSKRFWVLLMAALMALALVACGNSNEPTPTPVPTPTPDPPPVIRDAMAAQAPACSRQMQPLP